MLIAGALQIDAVEAADGKGQSELDDAHDAEEQVAEGEAEAVAKRHDDASVYALCFAPETLCKMGRVKAASIKVVIYTLMRVKVRW